MEYDLGVQKYIMLVRTLWLDSFSNCFWLLSSEKLIFYSSHILKTQQYLNNELMHTSTFCFGRQMTVKTLLPFKMSSLEFRTYLPKSENKNSVNRLVSFPALLTKVSA